MLIYSLNTGIKINAEECWLNKIKNSDFIDSYIPELKIINENGDGNYFVLNIQKSDNLFFHFSNSQATLRCDIGKNVSVEDVITVIEYCLEFLREKEGIYCVHGSAVSYKGKGILFLGAVSGLGKTTIASNFCLKYSGHFIGDEKILINNNLQLIGGIKRIVYNKEELKKSIYTNLNKLSKEKLNKKIVFSKNPVDLKIIIQPLIVTHANVLEEVKWPKSKLDFHIYEELSRKIRGTSRRINDSNFPLKSIDCQELSINRSKFSKKLSDKIDGYLIKGNLEDLIAKIIQLI